MKRWLALLLPLLMLAGVDARAQEPPQVLVMLQQPAPHYRPDQAYGGAYAAAPGRLARRAVAEALARAHGLAVVTGWPVPALGLDCWVLALPAGRSADALAGLLSQDRRVAWAQPMNEFTARAAPAGDPLYPTQPTARAWGLAQLHTLAQGRGATVAVVDSGVDLRHPDLLGRIARAENHADAGPLPAERHGTAVAGIIGAAADDGTGIRGIAPAARLLALRACREGADGATRCSTLALARALQSAIDQRADVVNLSLAGPPDRLLAALVDAALARGAVVVAAFDDALPGGGFPAAHPGVLAVAGQPRPGVASAPAHDVPVPVPGGGWALVSGSSYAAAQVAGLVALRHEAGRHGALVLGGQGQVDACASLAAPAAVCAAP